MIRALTISRFATLSLLVATSVHAGDVEDALRQYVIQQAKESKQVLPVKAGPGKAVPAAILAADDKGMQINMQGAQVSVTWKMLGDEGLYELFEPLLAKSPGPVHAQFLKFATKIGRGNGPLFEKQVSALWEKDPAAAKILEAALMAPKKPAEPALATPGTSGASGDAENKESASTPAAAPSKDAQSLLAGGFVTREGKINRDAYQREALAGDLQTIHRMLGPDYEAFSHSGKTDVPTIPAAVEKHTGKIGRNGQGFPYQFGTPVADPGGYWTTQGQILYVPDKAGDFGVDRVEMGSYGHHVLNLKPGHAWWGGAHPEPAVQQKPWAQLVGGPLGQPFAIDRAYGSFSENGYMIFKSGLIGAGAVNNIYDFPCFMFPHPKIPMAITLTSKNEFALVAIWDIQETKGQLAVLALGSTGDGRTAYGLPSWGINQHIKLLGYVDLPGMAAPSDISASTFCNGGTEVKSFEYKFDDAAHRAARYKQDEFSRTGVVCLISRAEGKVAFVDLQPLLAGFREMYFTTPENAAICKNAGPDPKQWPFTFEVDPRFKPKLLSVIDAPHPTAVRVSPLSPRGKPVTAFVATLDGRCFIYDVGALAGDGPHGPGSIKPLALAQVGRNPCCVAYQRYGDPFRATSQGTDVGGWASINNVFLVCCRGDREICWVEVTATGAETYRRLRDSRWVDPVHCQQTRINSGDGGYILTVADFKGRKMLNYRFGDVHIDGINIPISEGKSEVEFTGSMDFPGHVFRFSSDNVP